MEDKLAGKACRVGQTLAKQVQLIRSGQRPRDGQLRFFRDAIEMEEFNDVALAVWRATGCRLFSTLQDIEILEENLRNHDIVELVAQCCLIPYFFEHNRSTRERLPDPSRDQSWPFSMCQSLEEIAHLRSRLRFVEDSSSDLEQLNISLVLAVSRCFRKQGNPLNWQGLLLVFREASPGCNYRLLMFLVLILQDSNDKMPADAASLFLSYVSSAIYVLTASLGNYICPVEEKVISKLLELGGSPMITKDNHHVLFARLEKQLPTKKWPRWIRVEDAGIRPQNRNATVLNRLLAHQWTPHFWREMARRTCCSLDAVGPFKKNYAVEKIPNLACLASQKLREADLGALSRTMKFIASKHRPMKLQDFSDLR